jgi:hypothetical protein
MIFVREASAAVVLLTLTLSLQCAGLAAAIAWARPSFAPDVHRLGPVRSASGGNAPEQAERDLIVGALRERDWACRRFLPEWHLAWIAREQQSPVGMQKLGFLEQLLSNQNAGLGLFNLLLAIPSSEDCAVLSEVRMFYGSQNEL